MFVGLPIGTEISVAEHGWSEVAVPMDPSLDQHEQREGVLDKLSDIFMTVRPMPSQAGDPTLRVRVTGYCGNRDGIYHGIAGEIPANKGVVALAGGTNQAFP